MHMVNCNCLRKTQPTLPCHEYTCNRCFFGVGGVGKNWASPFFPHPDKVKQQPYSDGGGEYCRAYGKSSAVKHSQRYPVMNAHIIFAF